MRLFNPTRSTAGFCLLLTSTAFAQSPSAAANATSTSAAIQPTTVTLTTSVNSYQATSSGSSQIAASTAVPSPTVSLNTTVPYAPLPPVQDWCPGGPNSSYCPGPLLQLVQLSGLYADSKVFPDKPTNGTANETAAAFSQLSQNATVGEVETFVEANFRGEGLEIVPVAIEGFNATPAVLNEVEDPFLKGFVSIVNGYWALLIRETNTSAVCTEDVCDSSLIPLNNTIVVPGGRYREVYYWDSFWILEGLLRSELYEYANDLLTNFMDLLDLYGFLPNGGRKYYLNRSQPPVFVQMVNSYILVTGNTTILERALPLMEIELEWWRTNRTFSLTSPFTGRNHSVAIFNVTNSAPRPEGYVEDYETAFGASPALNETQRSALYAELATGAESGWDYSSRWCKEPLLNVSDNYPALRTLNGRAIVPVDLNALLYGDHVLLANLYETYLNGSTGNATLSVNATGRIAQHRMIASEFESAILDLFWDPARSYFYDFNTTANDRATIFHPGGLFPLWQNITPSEIVNNETAALNVFQGVRFIAGKYPGSPSVATLLETGLNWDAPNVWPPHTYTSIKALETIGRLYPNGTVLDRIISTNFSSIPVNQLGLNETDLPEQPQDAIGPNSAVFARSVADVQQGLPWWKALAVEYANRYMLSAFCSWYSTGGAIPGVLNPLSSGTLNATGANPTDTGHIFEKFNATDVDAAGGGGEYEVVIGFGWTNGVILHTAGEYGQYLVSPACPLIVLVDGIDSNVTSSNSSGRVGSALAHKQISAPAQGYRVSPMHL